MFLLLDLDNTLLPSKPAYDFAIAELAKDWKNRGLGEHTDFLKSYQESREIVKLQLASHSSNRLRLLCFKNMIDRKKYGLTGEDIDLILWLEERYFYHFGNSLKKDRDENTQWAKLFSILKPILDDHQVLILTNETLRTQLLKLQAFFPRDIPIPFITSEEVGVEKPDKQYFQYALKKANKQNAECIMIGDNFIDDIQGANQSGISGIHLKSIFGLEKVPEPINSPEGLQNYSAENIIAAIDFAINSKPNLR